jgi:cellobiose transport system permease protein
MLSTAPQLLLAVWLAHLLNRPLRAQTFFRITLLLVLVFALLGKQIIWCGRSGISGLVLAG